MVNNKLQKITNIDFILTGVARSGTTIFTQLLNIHPYVFCSEERFCYPFEFFENNANSFNDKKFGGNHSQIDKYNDKLRVNNNVLVGEKNPEFLYIPHKIQMIENKICIYRRHSEVVRSWDARASNINDSWDSRKTGFYSLLDLFLLLYEYPIDDSLFVSYESVFNLDLWKFEIQSAIEYLGLSSEDYDFDILTNTHSKHNYIKTEAYESDRIRELVNLLNLEDFENQYFNTNIHKRSNILREYRDSIRPQREIFLSLIEARSKINDELYSYYVFYRDHLFKFLKEY